MDHPRVFIQVTSCNRLEYLKCFFASLQKLCRNPRSQYTLSVVDNASEEAGLKDYLRDLARKGAIDHLHLRRYRNAPWEQYEAKNIHLDLVDAPYIWDVQDDVQVLRPFFLEEAIEVLEAEAGVSTVHPSAGHAAKHDPCRRTPGGIGYTIIPGAGYADQGFYRAKLFEEIGYFKNIWSDETRIQGAGEAYYKMKCDRREYAVAKLKIPFIHGLKVSAVRGARRFGDYFVPVGEHYFKVWSEEEAARLDREAGDRLVDERAIGVPDGWDPDRLCYCRGPETWAYPSTPVQEPATTYAAILAGDRGGLKLGEAWYHEQARPSQAPAGSRKGRVCAFLERIPLLRSSRPVRVLANVRDLLNAEAQSHGGPLEPHLKREVILDYGRRFGISTLVETGTFRGEMIDAARKEYSRIISVELDPGLFARAQARFQSDPRVTLLHGDSSLLLEPILASLNEPCVFWLDSHYSGPGTARGAMDTPILRELAMILEHEDRGHVILIDDARAFGQAKDYPTVKQVKDLILSRRPGWEVTLRRDIIRAHGLCARRGIPRTVARGLSTLLSGAIHRNLL